MSDAERLRAAHAAYRAAEGKPDAPAVYAQLERVVADIKRKANAARVPRGAA